MSVKDKADVTLSVDDHTDMPAVGSVLPTTEFVKPSVAKVPVVVLAGGKGTRLRPFTASFPKPLVPLSDTPILGVVLQQLASTGFKNVTLSLGHLSELIEAYVSTRASRCNALTISTVNEDKPSGTAGSLRRVPNLDSTFMVMNGDVLTDLNYSELIKAHRESGATVTIAAFKKDVRIDLGVLVADEDGWLTDYVEKPTRSYEVSMGVYVYEPRALNFIEEDEYLDFPDLIERLLAAGEPVSIFRNDAFWLDIGRPEDYALAQDKFEESPDMFGFPAKS